MAEDQEELSVSRRHIRELHDCVVLLDRDYQRERGKWREIERNLAITRGILEGLLGRWEEGQCRCAEVGDVGSEEQTVAVEEGGGCEDSPVYEPVWEVGHPASGCSGDSLGIDELQHQNEERAVREEGLCHYRSTMVVCRGQHATHSSPYTLSR